ncbi:hypothetical protein MTR67_008108 [Solanum verrucosum]|uniref:Uncharacterized protein n=1 Tax=Solanum verrucosum TaxID=315347 RepID=A0AAF0TG49_SOLVR|nr:hypothetical protein MTR67_008108 [Solanum verrucosum]
MRGGVMLVNTVLDALPTYVMSLFLLPCKVRKIIDALRRNFIWQGNKDNKACHLVNLNTLITSKKKGDYWNSLAADTTIKEWWWWGWREKLSWSDNWLRHGSLDLFQELERALGFVNILKKTFQGLKDAEETSNVKSSYLLIHLCLVLSIWNPYKMISSVILRCNIFSARSFLVEEKVVRIEGKEYGLTDNIASAHETEM